jgi:hypothetical protein
LGRCRSFGKFRTIDPAYTGTSGQTDDPASGFQSTMSQQLQFRILPSRRWARRLRLSAALMVLGTAAGTAPAGPSPDVQWRWTGVDRVVAFADVHGAYDSLVELLQAAEVLDHDLHWSGDTTHLVSLGDLVDRGAHSRKVMDLLMRLQQEARAAGGRVHVTLGNHEVMNLTGENHETSSEEFAAFADEEPDGIRERAWERSARMQQTGPLEGQAETPAKETTEEKKARFDERYPPGYFGHQAAFAPRGHYGSWLLGFPVLIVINDTVFLHGGLTGLAAKLGGDEFNKRMRADLLKYIEVWRQLIESGLLEPGTPFVERPAIARAALTALAQPSPDLAAAIEHLVQLEQAPIHNLNGPVRYRKMALCNPLTESDVIEAGLERLQARRVVAGHTTNLLDNRVYTLLDGKVILLDTGMLGEVYGGRASALILEQGQVRVLYGDTGATEEPQPTPRRVGWRPDAMTDDQLEDFLRTAPIVASEDVGEGVTRPRKLTLRRDGLEIHAIFSSEATPIEAGNRRKQLRLINDSDRYHNRVAAYRLDRLLGLNMIPVTVLRRVDGKEGALQFWVEGLVNELERQEQGVNLPGYCPIYDAELPDQWDLMMVFDMLVYDEDRTLQHVQYIEAGATLVLIDNSRTFRTHTGKPKDIGNVRVQLSAELERRLEALTYEQLKANLGDLLVRDQLRPVLKRRDEILVEWRATRETL